jgi:hypothetical protein
MAKAKAKGKGQKAKGLVAATKNSRTYELNNLILANHSHK